LDAGQHREISVVGSFNNYAKKVRNRDLHIRLRTSGLYSCIQDFRCTVGNRPFTEIAAGVCAHVGVESLRPATDELLMAALSYLETVRMDVLEIIRAYDQERKHQKQRGRPVPSKAVTKALEDSIETVLLDAEMLSPQHRF
jgi:hypothetical protein